MLRLHSQRTRFTTFVAKAVNEKPETDPDWEERKAKRQRFETPPVASPPSPRGSVASLEVDDDEVL